jgi:hypothetical protein
MMVDSCGGWGRDGTGNVVERGETWQLEFRNRRKTSHCISFNDFCSLNTTMIVS